MTIKIINAQQQQQQQTLIIERMPSNEKQPIFYLSYKSMKHKTIYRKVRLFVLGKRFRGLSDNP